LDVIFTKKVFTMSKAKKVLPAVCFFSILFLGNSRAFAHERTCGTRGGVIPEVVCGDENPPDGTPIGGYCALLGASFDQNGHLMIGNNVATGLPDYEASIGFVLAKQAPLSSIRWYTEAVSGASSAMLIGQIEALKTRLPGFDSSNP
jgi:hypothetical protein